MGHSFGVDGLRRPAGSATSRPSSSSATAWVSATPNVALALRAALMVGDVISAAHACAAAFRRAHRVPLRLGEHRGSHPVDVGGGHCSSPWSTNPAAMNAWESGSPHLVQSR